MLRYLIILLSLFLFLLGSQDVVSQTTIFSEDFNSYPDGTDSGTNWNTVFGNCEAADTEFAFNVISGAFTINDVEGQNCGCPNGDGGDNSNVMTISGIDISNYCDVLVNLSHVAIGDLECADGGSESVNYCVPVAGTGRDAFLIEAIIDATPYTLLYVCGSNIIVDNLSDPLPTGNNMNIRITGGTGADDEIYTIDNIIVSGYEISAPFTINADKTSICVGESLLLTADTDGPWLWNDGSTTKSIPVTPNVPTTYLVTVGPDCSPTQANITITPFALPIAEAGPNKTICFGESATLEASGGSSYTWDSGDIGPTPSVSPPSTLTYTVTVTSGPGCMDTDQTTVFVNDLPIVDAGSSQSVCEGDPVTLSASGATTYLWSNGMTSASITFTPSATETFSVIGTTDECAGTDDVLVTVKPNPIASISGDDLICEGGFATLTGSGGTSYAWSTTETSNSIDVNPSSTETFSLTVTANGCTDIETFEVNVASNPDANAGPDRFVCSGSEITLTAFGGSEYEWETGSFSQSIRVDPSSSRSYSVTVSNGNCFDTDEVFVTVKQPPTANIIGDLAICENSSTTLTASGDGTFLWSTNQTIESIEVSPIETTDYSVTVTKDDCMNTATVRVVVIPNPLVDAGDDVTVCEDGSIELNASGADSYDWDHGATGASITVSPSSDQIYTVTGTQNGCESSDQVSVNIQPKFIVDAGNDQEICLGSSTTLSATGGTSFIWTGISTGAEIEVRPPTTQTYFVTAIDGVCTATDEVEVVVVEPFLLQGTSDTTICNESNTILALDAPPGVSFNWSSGETTDEIQVNPSLQTTYSVTATDGLCDVTKDILVDIDDIELILSADLDNICLGDEIVINANSTGVIVWSDDLDLTMRTFRPSEDTLFVAEAVSNRGCRIEDQFSLTVLELPNVTISGQPFYCSGSTTEIMATSGLVSYEWADGNTDQSRVISNSGVYTIIGTDANGCSNQSSIIIEQNELPQPIITGSTTYCPGSSTELAINATYQSQQWSFDGAVSTTPTISISNDGTLTLEVTDQFGCTGSTDAIIESNPDLKPVITGNQKLCENTIGKLDVGDGFDNYIWSNGANTSTIDVGTADTYGVTVSTNDGCSGSASIDIEIVPNPVAIIKGETNYCVGESSIIYIDEFSEIKWSDGSTNDSLRVFSPGMITVTISDINGCEASDQISINELPLPDVKIIGDIEFCEGDSTRLEIESSDIEHITSILWDNGSITNNVYAKETSTASVLIKDRFGCENSASIEVIKNLNPSPQIIGPSLICEGTETKIYPIKVYNNYVWNNESQLDTLIVSNSGNYSLTVTDNKGCQGSDELILEGSETPVIEFKDGLVFCNTIIEERTEPLAVNLDTLFTQKNVAGNWTTSATNLDLSNLPIIDFEGVNPGIYEFIYTSSDAIAPCNNISQTVSLEVLDCNCPNVQFQTTTPLCSLSDKLDLSSIQSSNFEGSWQIVEAPSATLPNIDGDVFNAIDQIPGAYTLEFRLNDGIAPLGCEQASSINVEVAPHIDASIELINPACGGQEATFKLNLSGGESYDVEIMQDDVREIGLYNVTDGYTFSVPLNGATTLYFTDVRSNLQSCGFQASSDTYTFQASQLDAQVDLVKSYGDFGVSCIDAADGAAMVTIQSGTAPYTYFWSNGATTAMIDGVSSGSYDITVQDAVGCEFLSTINVDAPPSKQVEIQPQDPDCGQGPGRLQLKTLSGINAGQWELYIDGALQPETQLPAVLNNIASGNHTLEAVNEFGCTESHMFNIGDDIAFKIDIEDIDIKLGESAILQANINFAYESILWSPSIFLSDSSSQFTLIQRPLNSTLYTITVRDINDCVFQETVNVNVFKDRSLALPTGFTPNGDSNNDAFIIHAKSDVVSINMVKVFDRWGEEVFSAENVPPNEPLDWDWTFRNNPLPEGQYVWKANAKFIDNEDIDFNGKFYIIR